MEDRETIEVLEQVLAQMLKPLKNLPFPVIVKALAEKKVIPFDRNSDADKVFLAKVESAIQLCAADLKSQPIRRPRPNEVGNDIEPYVIRALKRAGLTALRPTSQAGIGKATGYPDILVREGQNRDTYIECKSFTHGKPETTMRSFYLSPSESFKVSLDARHLLLAFGMEATAISGSRDSLYTPKSYKLVDLCDLLCDVKYEFNSDNRRLYAPSMILSEGLL
jgi:hypothetical protein